jgi:cobalamin biosynthesis Mg chelatase CobN
MAAMKRLAAVVAVLAVAAPGLAVGSAHAAVPCRDRIYNDWYKDGKIASTYPLSCYRDALKNVPPDAKQYSSLADDIKSAMQAAVARLHGTKDVPPQVGKGGKGAVSPATATLRSPTKTSSHSSSSMAPRRPPVTTDQSVPASQTIAASQTSSGGGIPLPIIVLGAIALLLVAVGAVGAGVRHVRRR